MKHTKNMYILVIVICIVFFSGIFGCISIITTQKILKDKATEILNLQCMNACQEFDSTLKSIEQSVAMLTEVATIHMRDFDRFKKDDSYVDAYTEELKAILFNTVQTTQGAMSIYLRFNPEIASPTAGLFYVLNTETGQFELAPITDLSNKEEVNRIWYDLPVANGCPTWINPYYNENISYNMISYVIPYYIDNELVGIIGMDIDYEYIKDMINGITVYDTGYAFLLTKDNQVVVHKNFELFDSLAESKDHVLQNPRSTNRNAHPIYKYGNGSYTTVYTTTKNDMLLGISVPNTEIYHASTALGNQLIVAAIIAILIIAALTTVIISRAFRLSQTDELTGIHNRKYFINTYNEMHTEKRQRYCLFLFDIDHFKHINDTYGHNIGDAAIRNTALMAKELLGKDCIIARWGGDEFIGLIKSKVAAEQLERLRIMIEQTEHTDYGKITISIGVTEIGTRNALIEVTEAADTALYHSKSTGRNQLTYIPK